MEAYLDKAFDLYNQAVKAVSRTETEKKLDNALSNVKWGASTTELREISNLTYDYREYSVVMLEVRNALSQTRHWRKTFKALTLLEFLVKNGSERCVEDAMDFVYLIRPLSRSTPFENDDGVREKAKLVLELISNRDVIDKEREKAKELHDKLKGIGSDSMRMSTRQPWREPGPRAGRYNDPDDLSEFDSHRRSRDPRSGGKKKNSERHSKKSETDDDFDAFAKDGANAIEEDFGNFADGLNGGKQDSDVWANFSGDEANEEKKPKSTRKKSSKIPEPKDDAEEDLFGIAVDRAEGSGVVEDDDEWGQFSGAVDSPKENENTFIQESVVWRNTQATDSGSEIKFGSAQNPTSSKENSASFDPFESLTIPAVSFPSSSSQKIVTNSSLTGDQSLGYPQTMPTSSGPNPGLQNFNRSHPPATTYSLHSHNQQPTTVLPQNVTTQMASASSNADSDPWSSLVDLSSLSIKENKSEISASAAGRERNLSGQYDSAYGKSVTASDGVLLQENTASPNEGQNYDPVFSQGQDVAKREERSGSLDLLF